MPSVSFTPDDMIWEMLAHADLSTLPEADLLARVAGIYAFYPERVAVSLVDGRIVVEYDDPKAGGGDKQLQEGSSLAESGSYRGAIRAFERAIQVNPGLIGARRNLGAEPPAPRLGHHLWGRGTASVLETLASLLS